MVSSYINNKWLTYLFVILSAQSDEEAIKDELAQEYRAMQNQSVQRMQQQQQQQQQLAKKSSGIGKLFGRSVMAFY